MGSAPADVLASRLRPGMRVVVADGAGAPSDLLVDLTEVARSVGDISLVLGWCLHLPEGFDPTAFREVRTVMGGFALRDLVASGAVKYVPDRLSGVPALLRGPLRPVSRSQGSARASGPAAAAHRRQARSRRRSPV